MKEAYQKTKSERSVPKVGIAKQLLISILIIGTFLTLLVTSFHLYLDYKDELASIDDRFTQIEESYLSSLVSSLWVEDREQLRVQVEGIMELPNIHYLAITDSEGTIVKAGAELTKYMREKSWDMVYTLGDKEYPLATLTVQSDIYSIYQGIIDKFVILLFSHAVEAFLFAVFFLYITYRLVVHPLTLMSKTICEFDDDSVPRAVLLPKRWFDDEIYALSRRYNKSIEQIREHFIQIEEARASAETANRKKSEFLANMSHEIRTPMNGIIGLSSLMKEMEMPDDQKEYVKMLNTSSLSLLELINDILDFSKIEAGRLELEHNPLNLFELNSEVESVFLLRAVEKKLAFQCAIDRSISPMLLGDAAKLRQVLTNLLSNAIKFTDRGYVHLSIKRDSEDHRSVTVRFEVTDSGIGVPEEMHEAIFDKFQQADGSTTRQYGGTGLGLAICREIVRLMGGELNVASEPGKGSTFYFTVSLDKNIQAKPLAEDSKLLTGLSVLLVDDSMLNMRITSAQLSRFGATSTCCEKAHSAASMVLQAISRSQPFDLVLIDKIMPGMNGFELARQLKAQFATQCPKMAMISAGPEIGDEEKAMKSGISSYLARPYKESQLKWAISQAVHGTELPGEENEAVPAQPFDNQLATPKTEIYQGSSPSPSASGRNRLTESDAVTGNVTPPEKPAVKAKERNGQMRAKVLVVEDTHINQKVAKMMLEKLGVNVEVASNGQEAVSLFREGVFDLIFMDCQMPVLDGYKATEAIREIESGHSRIPIIALTANVVKEEQAKCYAAGMDDFVSKPVSQQVLGQVLDKYLSVPDPDVTKRM